MSPNEVAVLERIAVAVERIATWLDEFKPAEDPVCPHPLSERDVTPDSTMSHVTYYCKACGVQGLS